ncbi:MAG: complement resistance protein (plasmid) [Wigglesworthia glossinidia]|nr:complement resistance protein [Wigglesworthia glossinidia]
MLRKKSKFNKKKKIKLIMMSVIVLLTVTNCETINTVIKRKNLEMHTYMSKTIYLEPSNNNTVYVQIKNTSDKKLNKLQNKIFSSLQRKGYKITFFPENAHYWIQANILRIEKTNTQTRNALLHDCFEKDLDTINFNKSCKIDDFRYFNSIDEISSTFIEDTNFVIVTDIQISEKVKRSGVKVFSQSTILQGSNGKRIETSNEINDRRHYQTRILAYASQINLDFYQIKEKFEDQIANSISEIF